MNKFKKQAIEENRKIYPTTAGFILSSILLQDFLVSVAIKVNHHLDEAVLLKAVNEEIKRNEGLRTRLFKDNGKWCQFIVDPFEISSIRTIDMRNRTIKEVEAQINELSEPVFKLTKSDPTFEIIHFIGPDDTDYLLLNILHAFTDGYAASRTLFDILHVYLYMIGLDKEPEPLSSVADFLEVYDANSNEILKKREKSKEYYMEQYRKYGEPCYASARKNGFTPRENKKTLPPKLKLHKKVKMLNAEMDADFSKKCADFCNENVADFNALITTAYRVYYSAMNNGQEDITSICNLHNRAKNKVKSLQVSLAQLGVLRTVINSDLSFRDALKNVQETYVNVLRNIGFRMQDFDEYNAKHYKSAKKFHVYVDYLYSRIPTAVDLPDGWKLEGYWACPKTVMDYCPVYILALDAWDGGIKLSYRYAIDNYDEETIKKLHEGSMKILKAGMDNPNLTVRELRELV